MDAPRACSQFACGALPTHPTGQTSRAFCPRQWSLRLDSAEIGRQFPPVDYNGGVRIHMLMGPQICRSGANCAQSHQARPPAAALRNVDSVTLLAVSRRSRKQRARSVRSWGCAISVRVTFRRSWRRSRPCATVSHLAFQIGRLQANKTRPVAASFDWVHAVESP